MTLTAKERETLRNLAREYMEIAILPVQQEKVDLWKSLNRSHMQRPMVNIDQVPWAELNNDGSLTCVIMDPYWREVESGLRQTIYQWKYFRADMVVEPFIAIPRVVKFQGYGIGAKVEKLEQYEGTSAASQHFENVLNSEADIAKIQDMDMYLDEAQDQLRLNEADEIFGSDIPLIPGATFTGNYGLNLGIWDFMTMLMGIEDAYYAMIDEPDFIHACLNRLTESTIAGITKANDLRLHNDNSNRCHCSYIYTDDLLPGFAQGKGPVSENCWAFGLAQLFTGVSPEFMREFELPYISRMAEYFGMIYYGCCDRLDDRLDIVREIPNVRKVSCSPWSDRRNFAENIGSDLIMSNKPTPAYLAEDSVNWEIVRSDIRRTIDLAESNNVNLELILKDVSTVRFHPERLTEWSRIAMEEVCR